jgi:hypothetical protein
MTQATPLLTKAQWIERLQAWAVERWGQARAQIIRGEIEATAEHLVAVSAHRLTHEQMPHFFMAQ